MLAIILSDAPTGVHCAERPPAASGTNRASTLFAVRETHIVARGHRGTIPQGRANTLGELQLAHRERNKDLATDELLELFRVARTLNCHPRERAVDFAEVIGAQLDIGRAGVFFEAIEPDRPGYRNDPGLLGEHPGEGDLRTRDALAACNLSDQLDHGLVGLSRFRGEPRHDVAEIRAVEFRVL